MWRRTNAHNPKLITASNALCIAYQSFSKDLKDLVLSKRQRKQKKPFSYRKGLTERPRKTFTKLII